MTEPTDAELIALLGDRQFSTIGAVREALRRWGTPPAVAGDPLVFGDTTPQPTQAQAGAVPLTDEQIEALPLWKRFVGLWPETRREIVRTIEHHHGIKGGQHG